MYILDKIKSNIVSELNKIIGKDLVKSENLVYPPNALMGDLSLACFDLAKEMKKSPVEAANELAKSVKTGKEIKEVKVAGPYLNFTIDEKYLIKDVIKAIQDEKNDYAKNKSGGKRLVMVEFAHPNTHKAFHIGHLRNILTGESIARIMEANGYKISRVNYQGDIGLHIAKCLWGILHMEGEYEISKKADIKEKAVFLGKAYAFGSKNYEENEEAKKEIIDLNKKIYDREAGILEMYNATRQWSLDYFDTIYNRLNTKFDRLYFESEVFESGKDIVLENLAKGNFKKSEGAIIFEGENYGLHNRVFINSEGNPTYEAKDMGLAKLQFEEFKPERIVHVVGPEQLEYFKVMIKALEVIMPEIGKREVHLRYGWVRLKEGKMSSRLGNVVLGEWLLDEIRKEIFKIMEGNENLKNKEDVAEKVSLGAVKYSILKNGINTDISFDIKESISFTGTSGPYIQYTYARINSIIKKSEARSQKLEFDLKNLKEEAERVLAVKLAKYPEIVASAGANYDPSEIAKYLFELCKEFNDYYHSVQVLKAEEGERNARLVLLEAINIVIANGLKLLGIETVEEM